jgi:N-acetylneuraminic acid mutarotase
MNKLGLVLSAVACGAAALAFAGCDGGSTTTTTRDTSTTTVTAAVTSSTVTEAATSTKVTATAADGVWTKLDPAGDLPPARQGQSVVYDEANNQLILFGGETNGDEFLNDTWAYRPATNTWTELTPAGDSPSPRVFQAMVYDARGRRVILFGGVVGMGELNDTWAYDPAANVWTELHPSGELPPARKGHTLIFDPVSGRVILSGGWSSEIERLNDTWAYDPAANTWTNLTPSGPVPLDRYWSSVVYDSRDGKMILFGGGSEFMPASDVWAYDPAGNKWTQLDPAGDLPEGRSAHSATFDPAIGKMIVFGGGGWIKA